LPTIVFLPPGLHLISDFKGYNRLGRNACVSAAMVYFFLHQSAAG